MKNEHRSTAFLAAAPVIFAVAVLISFSAPLYAAEGPLDPGGLTMSITPPLFQLSLAPEAEWSSKLQFTNRSERRMTLYVTLQNFTAEGDNGMIAFSRPSAGSSPNMHELASWLSVPPEPIEAEAGETVDIPFTIRVPKDAEPGGHYAAIFVGTEPFSESVGGTMSVSSLLSSLILVRTTGDIVESGYIRDLSPLRVFSEEQEATLELSFVNTGNVHLTPRGEITITNMFGRERGKIIVGEDKSLGHVFPDSQRKFTFTWKGEKNFFDVGRYKVVATIVYGRDAEKTAYYTTHFWIVPWKSVLGIFSFLLFFGWFARRTFRREMERALSAEHLRKAHAVLEKDEALPGEKSPQPRGTKEYRAFLLSLIILFLAVVMVAWYFFQVLKDERSYQMLIKKDGAGGLFIGH